ncbi:putative cation-transporting ATPase E, partial [Mycobacterium montefiorense]
IGGEGTAHGIPGQGEGPVGAERRQGGDGDRQGRRVRRRQDAGQVLRHHPQGGRRSQEGR